MYLHKIVYILKKIRDIERETKEKQNLIFEHENMIKFLDIEEKYD